MIIMTFLADDELEYCYCVTLKYTVYYYNDPLRHIATNSSVDNHNNKNMKVN